jgi:hypothetical protein
VSRLSRAWVCIKTPRSESCLLGSGVHPMSLCHKPCAAHRRQPYGSWPLGGHYLRPCVRRAYAHFAAVATSTPSSRPKPSQGRLVRQKSRPPCRIGGQNHIKQHVAARPLAVVVNCVLGVGTPMPHTSSPWAGGVGGRNIATPLSYQIIAVVQGPHAIGYSPLRRRACATSGGVGTPRVVGARMTLPISIP